MPYQYPVTARQTSSGLHCYTGTVSGLSVQMIPTSFYRPRLAVLILILLSGLLLSSCNRSRNRQPIDVPTSTPTETPAPAATATAVRPAPASTPTQILPTPAELLALAQLQEHRGYIEEAASLYTELMRQPDPSISSPAAYLLGRLQISEGQWDLADDSLTIYFVLQGRTELPSEADYSAEAFLLWARVQRRLGAYEQASLYYEEALPGLPALASDIHREWGQMLLALDQDTEGLNHLQQAAELAHGVSIQLSIQDEIALALEARARYGEAVAVYDDMLTVSTQPAYQAQLLYRAGMALVQLGEEEAAIARFMLATETQRDTSSAYLALVELVEREVEFDQYTRGFIDYYAGAYDVAVEAFGNYRALELTEEFRAPYGEIYEGLSQAQLGDYLLAEVRLQSALANYPDCPCRGWAYQELLRLYLTLEDEAAYQETWETYIEELPTDPGRARILADQVAEMLHQGERTAAYTPLHDMLGFFPGNPLVAQALYAVVLDALAEQQYPEANSSLQQLREKFPDFRSSEVGFWTAYTLWHSGHKEAANFGWQRTAQHHPTDFFSIMAAQALRRADGTSQDVINDMGILSKSPDGSIQDDGSSEVALDWLRSWASQEQGESLPDPAEDINMQRGLTFHRLGNEIRARQNWAVAVETYRSYPYHLWDLALDLKAQGSYQLSIRAAFYLYSLSPAANVSELPLFLQYLIYPRPYRELAAAAADTHGVPEPFFYALLRQESFFESASVSSASAQGLGQIMPATGEWVALQLGMKNYEADWLHRPWLNLEFSAYYLGFVYDELEEDWLSALAGYNAGPGAGRAFREASGPDDLDFYRAVTIEETSNYLRQIVTNLWHYTRLYG